MFISLANALMIQGPVVILGAIAQPETVVIFSTSRTLARLGTSAANLINFSFSPEYSRLFGKGEGAAFRSLLKIHATIGAIGITGYVLILGVAGNVILTYWTHGKVPALYPFFAILNAAVAAEMTWGAIFTPLAAINLHTRVSYCFAVISILAIAISAAVAPSAGIVGVMLPVLATHSLMIFVAGWEFRRRLRMVCVSGDIRA
jgi:O-antigen/teichoic acid export membrane protein